MKNQSNFLLKKIKLNNNNSIRVSSTEKPKFKQIKLVKSRIKPGYRVTSALTNQNINNIVHLFKNKNYSKVDISWTLNLRNSDLSLDYNNKKYMRNRELMNNVKEPSFYQEDLEKYVKKKIKKSKSTYEVNLPTLNKYSYLYKNKLTETHGTILNNSSLLNFELTLRTSNNNKKIENLNRNYNKNDDKKEIKKIKWNNYIYRDKKKDIYTVNYNRKTASEKLQNSWLEEKLVMRPYKVIFKKVKYDNSNLITKYYIKDKEKAYNKLGENYSYKPYNDKYSEKNYNNIENLLNGNNKSQQNIWFQLSLRKDLKKNLSGKYK